MNQIRARAPAKLNLGLEILGRRPDGYHELSTVFQTIDLCDIITVTLNDKLTLDVDASIDSETNLAMSAAMALKDRFDVQMGAVINIDKNIPIAAGLGGASSNAATTLRALALLWDTKPTEQELFDLATTLGSDVPFFLVGGTVVGSGRGEILRPLARSLVSWIVLVVPDLVMEAKTRTMFGQLTADDISSGTAIEAIVSAIESSAPLATNYLPNAFTRAIYAVWPQLRELPVIFQAAGADGVAISGAGPSHYTLVEQEDKARAIAGSLEQRLGASAKVYVCKTLASIPQLVPVNG